MCTEQTVASFDEKIKQLPNAQSECSSHRICDSAAEDMNPYSTEQTVKALDVKIEQLSSAKPDCSIYRVHKHLRDVNKKAYEPQIVAIGPYHRHGDVAHLQIMEDHKVRYLDLLIKQKQMQNAAKYVAAIERVESETRKCYAEPINLDKTEFVQMLVLDGCFIIQLVRKYALPFLRESNDPIFLMDWIRSSLKRDLLLFENQVPYLVLCELYDLIEAPGQRSRLADLLKNFFKILYPENSNITDVADNEIKHLLSLVRHCWIHQFKVKRKSNESEEGLQFIRSATRLSEANVSFVKNNGAQLDVDFEGGVMKMAPLNVEDRTESLFRNLIAYEQYCYRDELRYVSHYVMFLDCLIDSFEDVEVLSHYGIIVNWLGDADVVAKMLKRLNESVAVPGDTFIYTEIFEKANEHCENLKTILSERRNKWMAILWRDYLNSPWKIISVVVGLVFLVLTITQTVFTIYSS